MRRAAALALLACLAGQASAQLPIPVPGGAGTTTVTLRMEIQDPGAALVPARPYALKLTVHYTYGPGGSAPPDQPPCADLSVVDPPAWAVANVTPPQVCFPIDNTRTVGGTTVDNDTALLEINITGPAPALQPHDITVQAHAPAIGPFAEATGTENRTIIPAFVGKLRVEAPRESVVRGGGADSVPVTITNQGNGDIDVRFRNVSAPQGVRVVAPEHFTLPLGASRTVELRVLAPWTTPVRGPVTLDAESAHPTRPDLAGDQVKLRFDVLGKAAVPGPELIWLGLGLAGAALLARRR
jgi:hypothetical protein